MHGCCQISACRQAPGVIGFDHPNEENPEVYDAAKSQSVNIRKMYRGEHGKKNQIDDKTAARWNKLFVGHAEAAVREDQRVPYAVAAEQEERREHIEKTEQQDRKDRMKRSEAELHRVDHAMKSGEIRDGI